MEFERIHAVTMDTVFGEVFRKVYYLEGIERTFFYTETTAYA
jgi:hypothetical protein